MFGTDNVARWSQLDPDLTTADTSRIARAISYAESYVEGRFRGGKYAVPLVALGTFPSELESWIASIAGVWLYKSRGMRDSASGDTEDRNRVTVYQREADKGISAVLAGMRVLSLATSAIGIRPTSPVAVQGVGPGAGPVQGPGLGG